MVEPIVYISECGEEYAESHIKFEVVSWIEARPEFNNLTDEEFSVAIDVVYETVMNIITWECPNCILDQIDSDEIDIILNKISERSNNK
jgi:hypothetical protein